MFGFVSVFCFLFLDFLPSSRALFFCLLFVLFSGVRTKDEWGIFLVFFWLPVIGDGIYIPKPKAR